AHIMARLGMAESYRMTSQPAPAIPIYTETIPPIRDANKRARLRLGLAVLYRQVAQPEAARRGPRIVEAESEVDMEARTKTILALLYPRRAFDWLLLLLVMLLSVLVTQSYGGAGAIIMVTVGLLLYVAMQIWGTPGGRRAR